MRRGNCFMLLVLRLVRWQAVEHTNLVEIVQEFSIEIFFLYLSPQILHTNIVYRDLATKTSQKNWNTSVFITQKSYTNLARVEAERVPTWEQQGRVYPVHWTNTRPLTFWLAFNGSANQLVELSWILTGNPNNKRINKYWSAWLERGQNKPTTWWWGGRHVHKHDHRGHTLRKLYYTVHLTYTSWLLLLSVACFVSFCSKSFVLWLFYPKAWDWKFHRKLSCTESLSLRKHSLALFALGSLHISAYCWEVRTHILDSKRVGSVVCWQGLGERYTYDTVTCGVYNMMLKNKQVQDHGSVVAYLKRPESCQQVTVSSSQNFWRK